MKKLFLLFLFVIISCSGIKKETPKAEKGVLNLQNWDFSKNRTINLDGEWEFYWEEFLQPTSNPVRDTYMRLQPGIEIKFINVPGRWNDFQFNSQKVGARGYATYRLQILLPNCISTDCKDPKDRLNLGIKLPNIGTAHEFWINGVLYSKAGKVGISKDSSQQGFNPELVALQREDILILPDQTRSIELLFLVSNYFDANGGLWYSINIGEYSSLANQERLTWIFDFFLLGSILIIGFYHLGLYLFRKKDQSPLWFGLYCILICTRIPLMNEKYLERIFPDYSLFFRFIEFFDLALLVPVFVNFLYFLFPQEIPKTIKKLITISSILLALPILLLPTFYYTYTITSIQIYILLALFYTIYMLFIAALRGREGAKTLLGGLLFFFIIVIHDILLAQLIIQSIHLVPFGLFVYIFSQAYLLSMRFSNAFKESEEQKNLLASAKMEIENLSKTKDQFLANLSHEIKTPLSVVFAYSEMLPANKDNPTKMEKYANQIYSNASKLNDFVSDLILMTDIESNIELQKNRTNLKTILEASITSLQSYSQEKMIKWEIMEIPDVSLHCDKLLLKKAFTAVLKNSIVYSKISSRVKIEIEQNNKFVFVNIIDSGIGIDFNNQERIFEKFFRVDNSLTYEVSGVGIGLFLAKKILELHNGCISVQSDIDLGSRFTIQIPLENR
ncbi:MAG: sensor histidine kinase [Leptospiraceae bacterium]|nr:sensor histidine kinase [Leptospiraceae bacterium]